MRPVVNADIDESEDNIATGEVVLHHAYVHNPDASDVAYFKVYRDVAANIDVASDAPAVEIAIPPLQTIPVLFDDQQSTGACWAAGLNPGADATAPSSGLRATIFVSP